MSRTIVFRRLLASIAGLVPFGYAYVETGTSMMSSEILFALPTVLWGWAFAFLLTVGLVHVNRLWAQVYVRGVWWANLILACVVALYERGTADEILALSLPCGAALLILGGTGLAARAGDAFQPRAFQGTLVAMLVMAVADTCSLTFWGGAALTASKVGVGTPLILAAVVMATACYGLYRLRGWAVFLNLAANVTIAISALSGLLDMPTPIRVLLATTAVGQLLVSAPLVVGVLRGSAPKANTKLAPILGAAAILTLLGIGVLAAIDPSWLPHLRS